MIDQAIQKVKPIALPFVVGLSIYTVFGTSVYFLFGKEGAHQFLNAYHNPYLDQAFKYITHIGHGLAPVMAIHILLLVRYSWALALGLSSLAMGIIVQLLKRSVFAGDHRPAMFFPEGGLPVVDGVDLMMHHSFPSGHSATAFCLCLMFALFIKNRMASIVLAALALLVAFSRVYISQHFVQDTIVGSWIGLAIAVLGYIFILHPAEENPASRMNNRLWPS